MATKLKGYALQWAQRVDAVKPEIDPLLVQLVRTDDFCRRGEIAQAAEHLSRLTEVYNKPAQKEQIARHSLLMVEHSTRFPAQLGSIVDNAPLLQVALQYSMATGEVYTRAHKLLEQSIYNAEAQPSAKAVHDLTKLYQVLSVGTANPDVREQAKRRLTGIANRLAKLNKGKQSASTAPRKSKPTKGAGLA